MKRFVALIAVVALFAFAGPVLAAGHSTNPFMDVPMNHWAYDAVSQLASRGVVSGYPDGAFKGEWKATRYEMASVVARALAYVDMNKASKEDLELLKRLVVEFKDELDALGVKVEDLDARVAVLESDIGGWALSGQFRFDAKWANRNTGPECEGPEKTVYTDTGETDFTMSRYRLWITKRIDDKVKFIGRVGGNTLTWERYYLDVKLPWDATMWVGLWNFDWEAESGLYADNDAWFTDRTLQGFYFTKPFNMGDFSIFLAHREGTACCGDCENPYDAKTEGYVYGARVNFHFNEQFRMAVQGIVQTYADAPWHPYWEDGTMGDWTTIWVDAGVKFTPDIELKGAYFWQQWECGSAGETYDPNAWKVILDVKQEAFGFTSLWLEYASFDERFKTVNAPYDDYVRGMQQGDGFSPNFSISRNLSRHGGLSQWDGATAFLVLLNQRWNDNWETFQRYVKFDFGGEPKLGKNGNDVDYHQEWNIGVRYWYTPSLMFELSYSNFDKQSLDPECNDGWDTTMVRFRTFVSF